MKINSSFRENNSEITPFIFFISMLYTSWLCCLSVLNIIFTLPFISSSHSQKLSNAVIIIMNFDL